MKNAKLLLECRKSSKTGNPYHCLTLDLGYTKVYLSTEHKVILTVANCLPSDLYSMGVGEIKELGKIDLV